MKKLTVKIKTFAELTADKKTTIDGSEDLDVFVIEHEFSPVTFTDKFEDALPENRVIKITASGKHLYNWYSGESVYAVDDWIIDDNFLTEEG